MDWFGTSATVCSDMFESCSFIPVQRIACRCAHALISVNFGAMVETFYSLSFTIKIFCMILMLLLCNCKKVLLSL